jgi:N-acetylneuraminic acid mutarotase
MGTLVALDDGGAVLIGHARFWKHVGRITQSFRFDAQRAAWSEIGDTFALIAEPTSKVLVTDGIRDLDGAMAARLPDGSVLVAGGAGEARAIDGGYDAPLTADAVRLVVASDTWTDLAPMPQPRARAGVVTLSDGSVLVVGGERSPSGDTVELASAVVFVP